ncbi:DUF3500 domain-containing protein [Urbifossiella limnaea]|uniref:DUF3500 domain-containing protein n=1 Tax=Urbifossiella limnaea TaxID=2528023 RepID=A0A517XQ40_9BACT|nr:DUF3500 domain-containing protein [Urbifossiella limnaea]QDU19614.1 hypothetical protein ETAA1_15440 [Urbifossiella limnaea]
MLPADKPVACPDCDTPEPARRDFFRYVAAGAVAAVPAAETFTPLAKARAARAQQQATSEAMVRELFATLTADQKAKVVKPWDMGPKGGLPARLATHNAAPNADVRIGAAYNRTQIEMLDRIFRSLGNGHEGYRLLSRNNRFDASGDFESIGAVIYGEPVEGKPFSLMFAGHHLTIRCDGNSEQGAAFGGPLYYGHTPNGYARNNVFYYQTRSLTDLFASLSDEQKPAAVKPGTWRDGVDSVRLPKADHKAPGVAFTALTADQKALVERVMRELVAPYRRADGDEVMEVIRANGGMEKLGFAFYTEGQRTAQEPWSFWRLEGPGFVWSFRALPHIHTFVNVSTRMA